MFFLRANFIHPAFRTGAKQSLAMVPGLAAWGLMTGVAMMNSGMSIIEACAMTLLVFAGSSQLAAIPLISAGAPMWVILATGFCVNLRFVVFSAHLREYLMHLPLWKRLVSGYLTADLTYVLFVSQYPTPSTDAKVRRSQEAYLAGNCFVMWVSWQGASLLGVFLTHQIPITWGLGFAGILSLLGILCSLASSKLRLVSAGVSAAAAVAAYALPLKMNILLAIASAVAISLMLEKFSLLKEKTPQETPSTDKGSA